MSFPIRPLAATALLALAVAGCSKSGDSASSQASPAATAAYSGSTDSSGGVAASAAPATKVVAGDPVHGKAIFSQNCSSCHGATGAEGGVGPSLKGEKARKDLAAAVAWIKNPSPPMPKLYPSPLSEKDVADVATYVESI